MNRRQTVHMGVEFERHALHVAGAQSSRLERTFNPFDRKFLLTKKLLGFIEVVFAEKLEAEMTRPRLLALAQNYAVVAALLERAQMDLCFVFVRDLQAERIDVKAAAFGEVCHHQFDVTQADDIKRRIEIGRGNGHDCCLR